MKARSQRMAAILTAAILSVSSAMRPAHAQTTSASPSARSDTKLALIKGSDSGTLSAISKKGKKLGSCPLKHTDVKADVSGYVGRVTVKQTFENPYKDKIEAIYTFPLPDSAAVDEMTMKVGSRTIHGTIRKREEAKQIYEQAKNAGQVASLLDQERTNIFTQSVANIEPGARVEITLKYVDLLPYEDGSFTFAFPTVVGPRFMPGEPTGKQGTGRSFDTTAVPDASRISPPVASSRSGHDISIDVHVNAGVPINSTDCKLHEVDVQQRGANEEEIILKDKNTIANKDFILSWQVAADKLQSGYLTHHDQKSGYFTIMMMPPKRVTKTEAAPKEMIFLIDCSGSQSGPPLQKAKETMAYILDHMNPNDTFQIISFSDHLRMLSGKPLKVNHEMIQRAQKFIQSLQADGGTWMAPAVEKACSVPADEHRLRIVTFMTDGYVGNDYEIIGMVKKLRGNSRWFPFGTGNSVNRTLIDCIAAEGGGEPDYVLLNSSGNAVGKKFYDRISSPVLTDVKVDFHGLPVKEVFPKEISDVWAQRPLYITGRYTAPAAGTVTISGFAGGKPYHQDIKVSFPEKQTANEVLGSIWARKKVDRLMSEDWFGAQSGAVNKELKEEIVQTALDHHIMTQYTSFVAVEEKRVTKGGASRTVVVPVEQPDGVSREMTTDRLAAGNFVGGPQGSFNTRAKVAFARKAMSPSPMPISAAHAYGGYAGGRSSDSSISSLPPPNLPPPPLPINSPMAATVAPAGIPLQCSKEAMAQAKQSATINEKADDERKLEPTFAAAKLDKDLQRLLNKVESQPGGLPACHGMVTVNILLTDTEPATLANLKRLGAVITITERSSVVAQVPINMLKRITHLSQVLHVSKQQSHLRVLPPARPLPGLPPITGHLPATNGPAQD